MLLAEGARSLRDRLGLIDFLAIGDLALRLFRSVLRDRCRDGDRDGDRWRRDDFLSWMPLLVEPRRSSCALLEVVGFPGGIFRSGDLLNNKIILC